MTILITGSRGKTALPLTEALVKNEHPVLVASRSPRPDAPHPTVRFDWHDNTTWELPFDHDQASLSPIDRVYLVGPDEPDTGADHVIAFMQLAQARGVKRMVLVSAWEVPPGGVLMGRAHQALQEMGKGGLEWAVLRPNFFMDNFATSYHIPNIKNGKLFSGAEDGSLAFVRAKDIAAVAYLALTDEEPHNTEHLITGPEALSHDQVAATLSDILSHKVEHVRLGPEDFQQLFEDNGLEPRMARYMVDLDIKIAKGAGSETSDIVQKLTGRPPSSLHEFVLDMKAVWM